MGLGEMIRKRSLDREVSRAKVPVEEVLKSPDAMLAEELDVYSAAGHIPESLQELLRKIAQDKGR